MKIFIASDHRGFALKEQLKQAFPELIDVGALTLDPNDDEVDYGSTAVKQMGEEDWAILLCGSGHGMDITANRFTHIRAILGFNQEVVSMGREHEDANVLVIPAQWTDLDQAIKMINTFLQTSFLGEERYQRRIEKYKNL